MRKLFLKIQKIIFTVQIDCTDAMEVCIVKANDEVLYKRSLA